MDNIENISWKISLILCLWLGSTLEVSGAQRRRSFRTQGSEAKAKLALTLSDMDTFKQFELNPFNKERVPDTDSHQEVQKHIIDHMEKLNWNVELDRFEDKTPLGNKTFTNIIATYNPRARDRLVLAAHYDSKYYTNMKFIGATDSAVPCAILMDIARTLDCLFLQDPKESGKNLTVQLIFFDGEEAFVSWKEDDSIYGARHLAEKWATTPDPENTSQKIIHRIRDFVLLDLIGTKDTKFRNIMKETSDLYDELEKIERSLDSLKLLKRQEEKGFLFSRDRLFAPGKPFSAGIEDDHIPFFRRNVPILHLISYPFPTVWHKESDNFSSLDYNTIEDFMRIFRIFVASYLQFNGKHSTNCRNEDVVSFDGSSGEDFSERSCDECAAAAGMEPILTKNLLTLFLSISLGLLFMKTKFS